VAAPLRGQGEKTALKAICRVDVSASPPTWSQIQDGRPAAWPEVIEDSCEALELNTKAARAGTLGDYGVYAFYPNKQITTGEGGVGRHK